MKRDSRSWLADINLAAVKIESYIKDIDFEDYTANSLIQDGVERNFINIGEALNLLHKNEPELAKEIPHLRKIVDFRNMLTHSYFRIKPETVWGSAVDNLPELHHKIRAILAEIE